MSSNAASSAAPAPIAEEAPKEKAVTFLAVGRVADGCCLATCNNDGVPEKQYNDAIQVFKKLLTAAKAKLKPGYRMRLAYGEGSITCLVDARGEFLFCVVTANQEYPEKFAYQLLSEFQGTVREIDENKLDEAKEGGLMEALGAKMLKTLHKYEDPANFDMFIKVMSKISTVKSTMQDNIARAQETQASLGTLSSKTEGMEQAGGMFANTAQETADRYAYELWKQQMITMATTGIIVAIFVYMSIP
eukprot:TRINITY_DN23420_c0_g1_i1.p1 TRINITY_DN23420_c0_g1~~TRINITY_DN23420_c0_g1_i1.p1  ORF type:complete len:246 (-),score=55.36 TRINITY_DN23420_c0_g1_i1:163-900(-)